MLESNYSQNGPVGQLWSTEQMINPTLPVIWGEALNTSLYNFKTTYVTASKVTQQNELIVSNTCKVSLDWRIWRHNDVILLNLSDELEFHQNFRLR